MFLQSITTLGEVFSESQGTASCLLQRGRTWTSYTRTHLVAATSTRTVCRHWSMSLNCAIETFWDTTLHDGCRRLFLGSHERNKDGKLQLRVAATPRASRQERDTCSNQIRRRQADVIVHLISYSESRSIFRSGTSDFYLSYFAMFSSTRSVCLTPSQRPGRGNGRAGHLNFHFVTSEIQQFQPWTSSRHATGGMQATFIIRFCEFVSEYLPAKSFSDYCAVVASWLGPIHMH